MRNYGAGANMGMDRPGANMGITAGHPSIMGRSDSAMDLQRYNSYFETRLVGADSTPQLIGPRVVRSRDGTRGDARPYEGDRKKVAAMRARKVPAQDDPLLVAAAAVRKSPIAGQSGLAEALELLSKQAAPPRDVTSWLCARIKANASVQIPEYPDPVLKGLVMKSDEFANIHILSKLGIERPHPAVWNFRRTETKGPGGLRSLPVFGVGQCHLQGLLFLARHFKELGFERVRWFNMREEPVVFLDGTSCAPRSINNLNENVEHLTSIQGWELDAMEKRLRDDCAEAAQQEGGSLGIFAQVASGENEKQRRRVPLDNSFPVRGAFEWLATQNGVAQLTYSRVPIADETAPEEQDFDQLIWELRDIALAGPSKSPAALVFNCQMGRGRTTTGMVSGAIMLLAAQGWAPQATASPLPEPDSEGRDRSAGEFRAILKLLRLVDSSTQSAEAAAAGVPKEGRGLRAKLLADQCCEGCAHAQHLVKAIVECTDSAKKAEPGAARSPEFWSRRAVNYLERYAYILLFAAYALEEVHDSFDRSFTEWSHQHWQFKSVVKHLTLE